MIKFKTKNTDMFFTHQLFKSRIYKFKKKICSYKDYLERLILHNLSEPPLLVKLIRASS
ncbi:hypothetical protein YC2023_111125 [Brassica napus]